MAIGYGSNFKPSSLSKERIGKPKSKIDGLISFFRLLTTIVELGATFIPGIGIITETGIALVGGAVNQTLDAQSGSTSFVNTLFNFGAPIIGGSAAGFSNLRKANRIGEELTPMGDFGYLRPHLAKGFRQEPGEFVEEGNFSRLVDNKWPEPNAIVGSYKQMRQVERINENYRNLDTFKKMNKGLELFPKGALQNAFGLGTEQATLGGFMSTYGESYLLNNLSNTGLRLNNISQLAYEDRQYFIRLGATEKQAERIVNILRKSKYQIEATRGLEELSKIFNEIYNATDSKNFRNFIEDFIKGVKDIKKHKRLGKEIDEASIIYRVLDDIKTSRKLEVEGSFLKRIWRKIGTNNFNDKVVQKAQLIDPNDMGRAPIEFLYQKIKKKILRYFRGIDKLEDAFTKSGGIWLDSSWLMGYKVITDTPGKKLIMISFQHLRTNNKRPVLVWATNKQIRELGTTWSPGRYYLKTWALSRGGKAIGISTLFGGLSFGYEGKRKMMIVNQVLSFLPIPQLRNILSIVSNYVENFSDMAKGTYTKTWFKKFSTSMERSAISRTFRLAGSTVGSHYAGKMLGQKWGHIIGKELQRVGTNIFAKGINNVLQGKSFSNGLKGNAKQISLMGIRTNLIRKIRHRKRQSVIVNTLTARRKLAQINRIPNAMVAGRPYKGFKY